MDTETVHYHLRRVVNRILLCARCGNHKCFEEALLQCWKTGTLSTQVDPDVDINSGSSLYMVIQIRQ